MVLLKQKTQLWLKKKSQLLQIIDFHRKKIHNQGKTELLIAIFNSAVTKNLKTNIM